MEDMIFYQAKDLGEHMHYLLAAQRRKSIQCQGYDWRDNFFFSTWKALSLGMRHSCFLSEASRNCYIFWDCFIFSNPHKLMHACIYPTLPSQAGCNASSIFFSGILLVWIQNFPSTWLVFLLRLKNQVNLTIYR